MALSMFSMELILGAEPSGGRTGGFELYGLRLFAAATGLIVAFASCVGLIGTAVAARLIQRRERMTTKDVAARPGHGRRNRLRRVP